MIWILAALLAALSDSEALLGGAGLSALLAGLEAWDAAVIWILAALLATLSDSEALLGVSWI